MTMASRPLTKTGVALNLDMLSPTELVTFHADRTGSRSNRKRGKPLLLPLIACIQAAPKDH